MTTNKQNKDKVIMHTRVLHLIYNANEFTNRFFIIKCINKSLCLIIPLNLTLIMKIKQNQLFSIETWYFNKLQVYQSI